MNCAGGESDVDFVFFKNFENGEVDVLLGVHVLVVVTSGDVVDDFEVEARVTKFMKVGAVKIGVLLIFYNLLDLFWNFFEFFEWSVVGDADGKHDPALVHAFEVLNLTTGEDSIGENQFFALESLDASGFDADFFDSAWLVVDDYKIADFERLVKVNGK